MHFNTLPVILLSSAAFVAAAPTTDFSTLPEVIPGPGLPSLQELNITSADLHGQDAQKRNTNDPINVRCGPTSADYSSTTTVVACYQYLHNLGRSQCVANDYTVMCTAGSTIVVGHYQGNLSSPSTSSYCTDVASAVLWTLKNCWSDNGKTAGGRQYAAGNGNFLVATSTSRAGGW